MTAALGSVFGWPTPTAGLEFGDRRRCRGALDRVRHAGRILHGNSPLTYHVGWCEFLLQLNADRLLQYGQRTSFLW